MPQNLHPDACLKKSAMVPAASIFIRLFLSSDTIAASCMVARRLCLKFGIVAEHHWIVVCVIYQAILHTIRPHIHILFMEIFCMYCLQVINALISFVTDVKLGKISGK